MSDPRLGRRLADRFDVLARLGSGATGAVYRARDLVAEREVALKVLFEHRLDEHQRARFRREGELTAALDHPGIVRVHSSGELPGGAPYLAYELIDGARTFDEACAGVTRPAGSRGCATRRARSGSRTRAESCTAT